MLYNICKVSKEGLKAKGSKGKASKGKASKGKASKPKPAKKLSRKQQLAAQKAAQKGVTLVATDKTTAEITAGEKTGKIAVEQTTAANEKTAAVEKQNMAKQNATKTPITSYQGSGSVTIANLKSITTGQLGDAWSTVDNSPFSTSLRAAVKTQPSWWTGSLSDWTNMSIPEQASQILQVGSW